MGDKNIVRISIENCTKHASIADKIGVKCVEKKLLIALLFAVLGMVPKFCYLRPPVDFFFFAGISHSLPDMPRR